MSAFVSAQVNLAASAATKIVDAEDFDRRVLIYGDAVRVAFTSAAVSAGAFLAGSNLTDGVEFVLPADEELWAYHSSVSPVGFIVSATG